MAGMALTLAARQESPWPAALAYLVERTRYKEHWRFTLEDIDRGQGSQGLTLIIYRYGPDAYHPAEILPVNHYFPVPPAAYNGRSWQRWLFERIREVESHEAAEFFEICDSPGSEHSVRPYAPLHGPGNDPYLIAELATMDDRRTSFRGELNDH
jgi:hypothetical protein